jgi:large subunit ribosomal protein L29
MMAIIKKRQLKELGDDDLQRRLKELRLELSKERAQIAIGGTPVNPGKVGEIKKTIARIMTELKKKEVVKTG